MFIEEVRNITVIYIYRANVYEFTYPRECADKKNQRKMMSLNKDPKVKCIIIRSLMGIAIFST